MNHTKCASGGGRDPFGLPSRAELGKLAPFMSGGMEFLQKHDRQTVGGDRKTQAGLSALCKRIVLVARVIFSAFSKVILAAVISHLLKTLYRDEYFFFFFNIVAIIRKNIVIAIVFDCSFCLAITL